MDKETRGTLRNSLRQTRHNITSEKQAKAAKIAFEAVQTVKNVTQSMSLLVEKTAASTPIITNGNAHGRNFRTSEGDGSDSSEEESID